LLKQRQHAFDGLKKKYKIQKYMFENIYTYISKLTYYNIIFSTKYARIKTFIQCVCNKKQIEIITVNCEDGSSIGN